MPISTKPTHLPPLTADERLTQQFQRAGTGNLWSGGVRFIKIRNRGKGSGGNSGTRTSKKAGKMASAARPVYIRPTRVPRWAHKYE